MRRNARCPISKPKSARASVRTRQGKTACLCACAIGLASGISVSHAQTSVTSSGIPVQLYEPERTQSYNQTGVNLPTAPLSQGQDEVRSANGVNCRASVGNHGPYVDMGLVGSRDLFDRDITTAYTRVVIPLGKKPKRLDCSKLYALEIERLRMELEMMKMSLPPVITGE